MASGNTQVGVDGNRRLCFMLHAWCLAGLVVVSGTTLSMAVLYCFALLCFLCSFKHSVREIKYLVKLWPQFSTLLRAIIVVMLVSL